MLKEHSLNLFIIAVVSVIMIFLYGQIQYTELPFSTWDLTFYQSIATASPQISNSIPQPFAYRLLGPYIAGLLPFPTPLSFYLLTIVLNVTLLFLFYFFLRFLNISGETAIITVVLFSFNKFLFGFSVWNYFQINDILSLIILIVLFRSMFSHNWVLFGAAFLLGAVTKESVFLIIPPALLYFYKRKELSKEVKNFVFAIVPGIAVFILLRILINAEGETLVQAFLLHSNKLLSPRSLFILLIYSFVPIALLPLVFYKDTKNFFKENKYALLFIVLVFISTLFGKNNERLMAPSFIIFYLLIAEIIDKNFLNKKLLIFIFILCGFVSSLHDYIARFSFLTKNEAIGISLTALFIVTLVGIIYRIKHGKLQNEIQTIK